MSSSTPASVSPEPRPGPPRSRALGRLARSHLALIGLTIVGLTAVVGLVGPLVVTADPVAMDFGSLLKGPSGAHLLGTDQFGRDVLARLVWGARLSVSIGALAVALALVVGVPIGALSGYAGRPAGLPRPPARPRPRGDHGAREH
jgi:peptide/nickel transport system permease protein